MPKKTNKRKKSKRKLFKKDPEQVLTPLTEKHLASRDGSRKQLIELNELTPWDEEAFKTKPIPVVAIDQNSSSRMNSKLSIKQYQFDQYFNTN